MDLKELKTRIHEDGTVGKLLEELGCYDIKITRSRRANADDLVSASLPDGDNPKGVQIYLNENLTTNLVTRGISGDIYSLVGYILYDCKTFDEIRKHLYQIKTYICSALDYEHTTDGFDISEQKVDWNWWLRDIQKQRVKALEIAENKILDDRVIMEFVQYPWYGWLPIMSYETQVEFGISYHINSDRIAIPVHNKYGQLIGIKGRYVGSDKEILKDKKYNYIYNCSKSIELFNLHRALPYILSSKKCIVVEGAKTVMMLWSNGIRNVVSIEGDLLSPVQAKLLKDLGLDIELIFAFDKDKSEEHIQRQIRFVKHRQVYYLLDTKDRFSGKDSPCDLGIDIFMGLYENDKKKGNA